MDKDDLFRIRKTHSWRSLCVTCFCPGAVIGKMSTTISRESRLNFPCDLQVGRDGCLLCIGSCFCASVLWPISPLLACYTCLQRRNLHRIYPADVAWGCRDRCCGLLWPFALLEHMELIESKQRAGVLHYPWAYGLPPVGAPSDIRNQIVFIVGPSNSGKSTLLKKLCTVVGNETPGHRHSYIDIKITTVPFSQAGPFTLEIWDIPQDCIETSLNYTPDFVFLTYDSGDKESLLAAQDIYDKIVFVWTTCKSMHLVATKIDTWESYNDSDTGPYEQTGAEWRASCIELAIEAEQWTKKDKALRFSLVSSPMNEGVRKLLRAISYDNQEPYS